MPKNDPNKLSNLHEVANYWSACLAMLSNKNDREVASSMVSIISNDHDQEWREQSPLYEHIFELAAQLELPQGTTEWRGETWSDILSSIKTFEKQNG